MEEPNTDGTSSVSDTQNISIHLKPDPIAHITDADNDRTRAELEEVRAGLIPTTPPTPSAGDVRSARPSSLQAEAPSRLQFAKLRRRTLPGAGSAEQTRRADPRCKVKDLPGLKTFIHTVISGDLTTLPTQSQRDLAITIRREIAHRGLRPIRLMSELPKSEWRGTNWKTLRDNFWLSAISRG
jgi:hypothetical protein